MKEGCVEWRENYINNFIYEFTIPSDAEEFTVRIPAEGEERHVLFEELPEDLRKALNSGLAKVVKACLDKMDPEERVRSLRACATGEFFYFSFSVQYSDLGFFSRNAQEAVMSLLTPKLDKPL